MELWQSHSQVQQSGGTINLWGSWEELMISQWLSCRRNRFLVGDAKYIFSFLDL